MSQPRRAKKIDFNQPGIVTALRAIPGVTVEVGHDDIIVGYEYKTYWYEIKTLDVISKKTGDVIPSEITKTERERLTSWTGHYKIVWTIDMILEDMGITK